MKPKVEAHLPTCWGTFNLFAYPNSRDANLPHLALVHQKMDASKPVFLRVHSECLTGDVFGSSRCDCGEQLHKALQIAGSQQGVLLYLRQEGRGIGLIDKLRAYNLQDKGYNTAEANTRLGHQVDPRRYDIAVEIMHDLGIQAIHLITNNPEKIKAVEESQIKVVSRIPVIIKPGKDNAAYLKTKEDLMGHLLQQGRGGRKS